MLYRIVGLVLVLGGCGHAFQSNPTVVSTPSQPCRRDFTPPHHSHGSAIEMTKKGNDEKTQETSNIIRNFFPTPSGKIASLSRQQQQQQRKKRRALIKGKRTKPPRAVSLKYERDFFRQSARIAAMDSYVLVSTLTASMSFGALLGFTPAVESAVSSAAASAAITSIGSTTASLITKSLAVISLSKIWFYQSICALVPVVAGFSTILGLYSTIMFSMTILYSKAALGTERDLEYEKFLKRTLRPRVHGTRCFNLSVGLFMIEAFLVLIERTYNRPFSIGVVGASLFTLFNLYRDWRLSFRMAEYIYKE